MSLQLVELAVGYPARGLLRRPPTAIARDITVVAPSGELTVLVGPNGAGKSTLLRTVSGLQPALHGAVFLPDGTKVSDYASSASGRRKLARTLAIVLTNAVSPGRLTAREVVELGRTPFLGAGARLDDHDHERVAWALELVDAGALADRGFDGLSDGQRQRVLVARALAQSPKVLVLDEPTSYLDAPSRVEFLDLLSRLAAETGISVLMSSHELELALQVADQVWLLHGGVVQAGRPADVASSGALNRAFDRGRLRFDAATSSFRLVPEEIVAGVREPV